MKEQIYCTHFNPKVKYTIKYFLFTDFKNLDKILSIYYNKTINAYKTFS